MKNTHLAKTLTASLPSDARTAFARISEPDNLPSWHSSFCRSLRRENGALLVESPRGTVPVRFVRDDHSLVLDLVIQVAEGIELTNAIRVLSNGEGSEIVWTIVKPQGLSDTIFHEQLRWAGSALHNLRKAPIQNRTSQIEDRKSSISEPASAISDTGSAISDSVEPMQAPSPAEVSSMPLSGKKLFIGNLSYDWTDEQLRAHFADQGVVTLAEVARFRGRGGRSRGFGFVEMTTEAEAQTAIEKLHGGMAGGRQIIVRLAKSQESRPAQSVRSPMSEAPTSDLEPRTSDDVPEPGNEREPRSQPQRSRSERPPRRGGRPRPDSAPRTNSRTGSGPFTRRIPGRPAGAPRPYQEQDISNKSGYEIFPRRAPGSPEPVRADVPDTSSSRPPPREPSPYMDDTGDIENHGHRPPRQRRNR